MTIFEINIFGINLAPSYYGLMYAIGFLAGFYIIKKRGRITPLTALDNLFFYIFLGVILGGRLGYVFFYNFGAYLSEPLSIIKIWEGGMSFHGGVIGVILAMALFAKKYKVSFLKLADQVTLVLPIGLGLGRIGNYLNNELLGYSGYNGIFAVYKDGIGYFPSTLLEAILEGLILFIILNTIYYINNIKTCKSSGKPVKYGFDGQIATLFLIFYAIFRIIIEIFFRTPDSNIGYILGYFTMGELLTLPMLIGGIYIYWKLGFKDKIVKPMNVEDLLKPIRAEISEIDNALLLSLQKIFNDGEKLNEEDFDFILNEAVANKINSLEERGEYLTPLIILLSKRFENINQVGRIKADNNIPVLQQNRWDDVLKSVTDEANKLGLDEKIIITFWNMIHEKALELENKVIK